MTIKFKTAVKPRSLSHRKKHSSSSNKQRRHKKYRKTPYARHKTHKKRRVSKRHTRKMRGGLLSIKPAQVAASSMTPQEEAYQRMMKSNELQNHINNQTGGAGVAVPQLQQADPAMNDHIANLQAVQLQASANRVYDGNVGKDASADAVTQQDYNQAVDDLTDKHGA